MSDDQLIRGVNVALRPAVPDDRRQIFDWLFCSDVTHAMFGPPHYPERPIPPPEKSSDDYASYYFDGSEPRFGRCFLILVEGSPVGQINYNDIHECGGRKRVELDIWMRSESLCGKGYGTDALNTLCCHLVEQFGVEEFMVQPSARNPRL